MVHSIVMKVIGLLTSPKSYKACAVCIEDVNRGAKRCLIGKREMHGTIC